MAKEESIFPIPNGAKFDRETGSFIFLRRDKIGKSKYCVCKYTSFVRAEFDQNEMWLIEDDAIRWYKEYNSIKRNTSPK